MTALVFVALFVLTGVACGDSDTSGSNKTGSTLVENGDQQGNGNDGSVVQDPPGATPGGSQSSETP
jgi:hypothetical protein